MADIMKIAMQVVGQEKVDKANKSLGKMEKSAGGAGKSLDKLKKVAKRLGAALLIAGLIIKVTDALAKMGAEAIKTADKIGKTATKLGLTAEELQFFRIQAQASGVALEGAEVGFQRFTRRLEQAREGTGALNERFKQLGVELVDQNGQFKSNIQVFKEFGNAVGKIDDASLAIATTFDAVDTEGVNMINMFKQSEAAQEANTQAAMKYGGVLTNDVVSAMEEYQTQLGLIEGGTASLNTQRDLALAPLTLAWAGLKNEIAFTGIELLTTLGMFEETSNLRAVKLARITEEFERQRDLVNELRGLTDEEIGVRQGTQAAMAQVVLNNHVDIALELQTKMQGLEAEVEKDRAAAGAEQAKRSEAASAAMAKQMEQRKIQMGLERQAAAAEAAAAEAIKQTAIDRKKVQDDINKSFADSVALLDATIAADEALADQWRLAITPALEYERQIDAINRLLRIGEFSAKEAADAIALVREAQSKAAGEDSQTEMEALIEKWRTWEDQIERIKVDGIGELADTMTEFLLSGGKNFKEFAAGFIKQIAAMIIKALIFKAIMDAIQGFSKTPEVKAPTSSGGGGFRGFAHGGTAHANTPVMVGERGPELFTPNTTGRVTPNNQLMGGGSGSRISIGEINVVVKENKDETSQEQAENISKAIARDMRQMVQGELINQQRPGNILNPAGLTTFK